MSKQSVMAIKKVLRFISDHPEGVTAEDFRSAGIRITGIQKLINFEQITQEQIRDPDRGSRCYHLLWKLRRSV